ncbi:hypothetical protein DID77_01595 [Candidatus Marinamargulisbacteria bacterium SCGC AG-439-L15]|nr:hypothetical protein DID77_01595 [Candidatus Marinamargulisbacteria bacterium SCGC AG-439-L15]
MSTNILTIGSTHFDEDLRSQGASVAHIDWSPPAFGNITALTSLEKLLPHTKCIDTANQVAMDRLFQSEAKWIGMDLAKNVIPGMSNTTILHAGPPISWEDMSGPLQGAILGALVYEGLANDLDQARDLILSGEITFSPCHEHQSVGPMAGVISPSMPVFIIDNPAHRTQSFTTMNEGLGKVLRYGANGPEVIDRLHWMKETLYPLLKTAIESSEGIDLKVLIGQALHMGDEGHNRNKAASSLLLKELLPLLLETAQNTDALKKCCQFISGNDHFFLNLSMAAAKAGLDAASGIENSSLVTIMARNGTEFGIQLSGLPGQWFTGPANFVKGLLFPGMSDDDCNPDIGDSAITETFGIGGFTMAAAPAIVQFIGGTPDQALQYSQSMYDITLAENPIFSIPSLGFKGSPTGIDCRKVLEQSSLPVINTGIAHKKAGVGMAGAGVVYPPENCFIKAICAFEKSLS